jgi:hypothetical protein
MIYSGQAVGREEVGRYGKSYAVGCGKWWETIGRGAGWGELCNGWWELDICCSGEEV